ncbi:aminotransferase class IV [Patescibacteria group bacterium]|nr:aminotransferase class IV [Patescibacteria group bacterium]
MRKNSYCSTVFFATTEDDCGFFDSDTWPARNILEDHNWERSDGICEMIEVKDRVVFHLDDHLGRLMNSMKVLDLKTPIKDLKIFLKNKISELLRFYGCSGLSRIDIRVTGGYSDDFFRSSGFPNIFIRTAPILQKRFDKGLKLLLLDYKRDYPEAKTVNYGVAVKQLRSNPQFDSVLYVPKGVILEAATANFFMVDKRGIIWTPRNDILKGVTRGVVINMAKKMKFEVMEDLIRESDLNFVKEIFLTSTFTFVWPVTKISAMFNDKDLEIGPVTMKLREAYLKYRREYYKENFIGII